MRLFVTVMSTCVLICASVSGASFVFRAKVTYPGVPKPHAVVSADFNGDGDIDLVMANRDQANVGLYFGNGDNTFQQAIYYPAGALARDIAVADFNGDGHLDMAVANEASDSISVLINTGDGTFLPTVNYYSSHADNAAGRCRPWHIETADYNSDGYPDLAVSVTNRIVDNGNPDDLIYLFLNDGTGTFDLVATMSVDEDPRGLAADDFDLDGDIDLAVSCYSNSVEVFLNNGDTTFSSQSFYAGTKSVDICSADLDGDGDPDLAVLNYGTRDAVVLKNDGSGGFTRGSAKSVGEPWAINVADMDNDGDQDILVAASDALILENDGNANLISKTMVVSGGFPRAICGTDFDGDGDLDLAVANAWSFLLVTLENLASEYPDTSVVDTAVVDTSVVDTAAGGNFEFEEKVSYPSAPSPHAVVSADFNNDGQIDLAMANRDAAKVSVYFGNGDNSFQQAVYYPAGGLARDIAAADFNGDGWTDMAVANEASDSISILINAGDGTFLPTVNYYSSHASNSSGRCRPWHIEAADFNSDGYPDLAVSVTNQSILIANPDDRIYIFFNDGTGVFSLGTTLAVDEDPRGLAADDFDRDGDIDFAVACYSNVVQMFYNNGDSTFNTRKINAGTKPIDVCSVDLDGDGYPELAVANYRDFNVVVMTNDGGGYFTKGSTIHTTQPWGISSGDMDGDGDEDILVAAWDVHILENDGNANLISATPVALECYSRAICGADFNGDGDIDLAYANSRSFLLVTLENMAALDTVDVDPIPRDCALADLYLFGAQIRHSVGQKPSAVYSADFNNDGYVDIATANASANNVSVLLNDRTGAFGPAVEYPTLAGPREFAVADMDGDGYLDMVVANFETDSISVMINAGDGSFGGPTSYLAGHLGVYDRLCRPMFVETADLNNDSFPDVIVSVLSRGSDYIVHDQVYIFFNNGDGTLQLISRTTTRDDPMGISAGDFNADGYIDFAVACQVSRIALFMNRGDSTFDYSTFSPGWMPSDVRAVDLDGDDDLDLVITLLDHRAITTWLNDGGGSFSQSSFVELGYLPTDVNTVDIDLDGDPDLVVVGKWTSQGAGEVQLIENIGDGIFSLPCNLDIGGSSVVTSAADYDLDGYFDLAVSDEFGNLITIVLNAGGNELAGPIFSPYLPIGGSTEQVFDVSTVDLDGDGYDELAYSTYTERDIDYTATVFTLTRDFNESRVMDWLSNEMDTVFNVCRADLNGDGMADLVASNGLVTMGAINIGDGTFGDAYEIAADRGAVVAGDVNNDGFDDLILGSTNVFVRLNLGDGSFGPADEYSVGGVIENVTTGDLNGDGWIDLIIANGGIEILINSGDGSFVPSAFDNFLSGVSDVCFADFNGDGITDLATTSESLLMSVYLGSGDGSFTSSRDYLTGGTSVSICTADMDNDGFPDLAVANRTTNEVSVFINNGVGIFVSGGRYPTGHSPLIVRALDFDHDGDIDLAVGCRDIDSPGEGMGKISILYNMLITLTGVTDNDENDNLPVRFELRQNYPNPFNPATTIDFVLPRRSHVEIAIYNVLGQQVAILVDDDRSAGNYSVVWRGTDHRNRPTSSGVYFYRIKADGFVETKKMLLLK